MNRTLLISSLTILLLAGCVNNQLLAYGTDENYLNFKHPFTDKAIAEVLAKAEALCGQRKQVAIQTSKVCSLTQCTTNYQCIDQADVTRYGL
jgi:hypothetical protein